MIELTDEFLNDATKPENFRFYNPILSDCYNGLKPSKLSNIARIIFDKIICNLMKGVKGYEKSIYEKDRTFSDTHITVYDMLDACNPGKYIDGAKYIKGKNIETDVKNMQKLIKEIHDNNIHYCWSYKTNYMFFLERHIRCWKYYNPNAVVVPKSIKKILKSAWGQIDRMMYFEKRSGRKADREHINHSYGCFIEKMVQKMNPLISATFPTFGSCKNLNEYIELLNKHLSDIADFAGSIKPKNFALMLPLSVRKKAGIDTNTRSEMKNNKVDMEKELTSTNSNICSNKGLRKKREKKIKPFEKNGSTDTGEKLEACSFADLPDINPFENPKSFAQYYRTYMTLHSKNNVRFEHFNVACEYAGYILDDLRDIGKTDNRAFLDAWLKNYIKKLTETKVKNAEYTSLRKFRKSLADFSRIFYIP